MKTPHLRACIANAHHSVNRAAAEKELETMIAAIEATDRYFRTCARVWSENAGSIIKTERGAVVVDEHLDVLGDRAAELVAHAMLVGGGA